MPHNAAPQPAMPSRYPSYLALEANGELARRAHALYSLYRECRLCPRQCAANRLKGAEGDWGLALRGDRHLAREDEEIARAASSGGLCHQWTRGGRGQENRLRCGRPPLRGDVLGDEDGASN